MQVETNVVDAADFDDAYAEWTSAEDQHFDDECDPDVPASVDLTDEELEQQYAEWRAVLDHPHTYANANADEIEEMRRQLQAQTDSIVACITDLVIAKAKANTDGAAKRSTKSIGPNDGIATRIFDQLDAVMPTTDLATSDVITVVVDERNPLGKRMTLHSDGTIDKDAAVTVWDGVACQYYVPDHETLSKLFLIVGQSPNAAICNTAWRPTKIGERFVMLSTKVLESKGCTGDAVVSENGMPAFARLKDHAVPSSWLLLDRDIDSYTPEWASKLNHNEWLQKLDLIIPGVLSVSRLKVPSSSSRVVRSDGTPAGSGNGHVWIKVMDAGDIERLRSVVMLRAIDHGLAWKKPKHDKKSKEVIGYMDTTIFDPSVFVTGRLVFIGQPTVSPGLSLKPWTFEFVPGLDVLDTSRAEMSELKAVRIATPRKIMIRVQRGSGIKPGSIKHTPSMRMTMDNLSLETPLELMDGSIKLVKELLQHKGKLRCQAPFRSSQSFAAFFVVRSGKPMVYDSGTNVVHVLPKNEPYDKKFSRLTNTLVNNLEPVLGSALDAEIVLNTKNLRNMWDANIFCPANSKVMFLNQDNELIELPTKDVSEFALQTEFPGLFKRDLMDQMIAERYEQEVSNGTIKMVRSGEDMVPIPLASYRSGKYSSAIAILIDTLIEHLKLYKQVKSLRLSVDIFSERGRMDVVDGVAKVDLPHRLLAPAIRIEQETVKRVVADYLEHFPEFMPFLNMVIQSRFASDRRHAFVWLHASSSWGKGLLLSVFQQLGLVFEASTKEIDKALDGSPVGLSTQETLRAWIMFVDEFKSATSELKQLNSKISLAPKHALRCEIPLYTKLFASAEEVRSLIGDGVEQQFNNRFSYLHPSNFEHKIENRDLFQEVGNLTYLNALATFVADHINAAVATIRPLGVVDASRHADKYLKEYQQGHRLAETFGKIDDTLDDIVSFLRKCLRQYAVWVSNGGDFKDTPRIVEGLGLPLIKTLHRDAVVGYISKGDGSKERQFGIVLANAEKFVREYLNLSGDRSTIGKIAYKTGDITERLNMRKDSKNGRVRVYDSAKQGANDLVEKRGIVIFERDDAGEDSEDSASN